MLMMMKVAVSAVADVLLIDHCSTIVNSSCWIARTTVLCRHSVHFLGYLH